MREDVVPTLADEGGARERGWLQGEANEDLLEEIIVIQRGYRTVVAVVEDLGHGLARH
jgi:hypothetical protein